jgi:HD-GYP domain-containing protein (c-di-GMP phosphodiesterase class II)
MFALMLAKLEGLESEKTLTALGLGALLHDLGMSMIAFDAEDKEDLKPEEFKEVRRHPELGKRILDQFKSIPAEARTIVMQHHEQPNGSGYPNNMHGKEIYYLAKIVAIADSFSALVSKRPFREPYSAAKALEVMSTDRGKFDDALLAKFMKIFIHVS